MIRVVGVVSMGDDPNMRARLLRERPFLKTVSANQDDSLLAIFQVEKGEAWFWTMADNM